MSFWLRDYIYIPLGGSRRGNRAVNVLATFLFCGLWHWSILAVQGMVGRGSIGLAIAFVWFAMLVVLTGVYYKIRGRRLSGETEPGNPVIALVRALAILVAMSVGLVFGVCPVDVPVGDAFRLFARMTGF